MVLDLTGLYRQAFYDEFADKDACYLEAFDFGVGAARRRSRCGRRRARRAGGASCGPASAPCSTRSTPTRIWAAALIVEVHAAGPEALKRRCRGDETGRPISSIRRGTPRRAPESPPPIAAEGIVAGMHAVVHAQARHRRRRRLPRAAAGVHVLRRAALFRRRGGRRRDAGRARLDGRETRWTGRRSLPYV